MKLVFAGAPEFSVLPLKKILEEGYEVAAVVTQPDKPVGRKAIVTPTPLKVFARSRGIPVLDFPKIREHIGELESLRAHLMVTCAYGQLLTESVLNAFPAGVYNIHASLLPKYRGASPVAACILNGETETGITVMKTDVGLDTGDMLLQKRIPIAPEDTAGTLSEKLSALGADCIVEALALFKAVLTPQDNDRATLVKKIKKEHARIDFTEDAAAIVNLIRAMNPAPVAYTYLNGKALNVFFAETAEGEVGASGEVIAADKRGILVRAGKGAVRFLEVQSEGGKRMRAADFVNGRKIAVGDVLTGENA